MAHQQERGEAADYYNQSAIQQQAPSQDPYPQKAPPEYGFQPNYNPDGEKLTFDQTFKVEKPKFNDVWAGALFLAVCAGFVAISGISLQGYAATRSINGSGIYDGSNDFSLSTNTIILFAFVLSMALVLSFAYLWLARVFPRQFIFISGVLNVVLGFATAIYMLSRRYWSGGIVFLLFAIFTLIAFISWIKRIPFSALLLRTSVDVAKRFGHVYLISFIGGLVALAFSAWWSVTLVAVYVKYEQGNNPACSKGAGTCSNAKVIGLVVFLTFAGFWISEFLKYAIHTSVAGVYGAWYFCSGNFPKGATRGAARRALTYSFGSLSLGSLIIAIINFLRQICSIAQSQDAADGNIVGYILFCVLQCFISILDWAVEFINRYSFAYIALYGKSYFAAAKDTWRMIKSKGIDALINDCLIGPVLSLGSMAVGFLCALLSYLYLIFTKPAYNKNGDFTPVVIAFSFLIGLQICQIVVTPISSGIDTLFVAMAFDPIVLQRDHPDLFAQLLSTYPALSQAIHV